MWRGPMAELAVGTLTGVERSALRAHLEGCGACAAEQEELLGSAAALADAAPDRIDQVAPALLSGIGSVLARVAADQRRGRIRAARLTAIAAALLVVVGLAVTTRSNGPSGEQVAFAATSSGVEASARLQARPWGTIITLTAAGLEPGIVHHVWLEAPDGTRTPAGTFTAVRGRTIVVQLAAGVPLGSERGIGVSGAASATVLHADLRR